MKKKLSAVALGALMMLALAGSLVGCGDEAASKPTAEDSEVTVYSVTGSNEVMEVHDGVIVAASEEQTIYGGKLQLRGVDVSKISNYRTEFYVLRDGEKEKVLISEHRDETGDGNIFSETLAGAEGELMTEEALAELEDNFYLEVSYETVDGEKDSRTLKLNLDKVTGMKTE